MSTPPHGSPAGPESLGARARLTPDRVRRLAFGRSAVGRRGYLEADVERFRAQVIAEITAADAEKAELRETLARHRAYVREHRISAGAEGETPTGHTSPAERAATVQAVSLLSRAQQAADQHIAEATDYAHRLMTSARMRYEQVLAQARAEAERAAALATAQAARHAAQDARIQERVPQDGPGSQREREELEAQIAYLRTFAHVAQVQLTASLDALRREVDQLAVAPTVAPRGFDEPRPLAPGR